MYSITDRSTFEEVERFRAKILNVRYLTCALDTDSYLQVKDVSSSKAPPIVLVGNKADLEETREVSTSEGQELAKIFNCDFFEASAKTRTNVQERYIHHHLRWIWRL